MSPEPGFFVLTGGPGSGKTTMIETLNSLGRATTQEAGRGVIREQQAIGGTALPWADRERFAKHMFEWELRSYRQATTSGGPVFFDRGLPDTIGYLRLEGLSVPPFMEEKASLLRYNTKVFIAPPWRNIYGQDNERRQDWDVAVRTYEVMAETYAGFGYDLVELPRLNVAERTEWLLRETEQS